MKKFLFLLLALVLSVSVSCSDDKTGDTGGSMLSVTPTEIEFEAAGGSRLLDLRTDAGAWSLTQSDNTAWCTPALTSGKTSTSFAVTATANESSKRSATLTFTAPGCDPVVVTVTQSGDASQDFEGEQVVAQPDAWDNRKRADISYQLLVYSFADGNGDKVGDLPEPAPEMPDAPGIAETPVLPGKPAAGKGDGDNGVQQGRKPAAGTDDAAPAVDVSRPFKFTFYGTGCSVSLAAKHRFNLASVQENSVANAWEGVSRGSYDAVAAECVALKKALGLNDWGYYDLVRTLADGFCGPKTNESVVLQSFLMAEAGYKVRMARGDGRLFLLLATDGQVYARPYFNIDGQVFYILDDVPRAASYNICNFTIPGERPLSLAMPAPPLFAQKPAAPAVRNFDGVVSTTVTVNRNLMDFYTNYPPCHWSVYAATALTAPVRGQLYPPLRAAVAGKGEREAAELLLHYLHRAFPYKTDEAQFGVERTLFAEEMYYYPYSDCEDRSILFARLVKDLLGLDVVLLYYPAHIATAVCFKGEVKGDYMQLGNKRYVICDATYIGAGVGEAMPDLKRTPAQVVRID